MRAERSLDPLEDQLRVKDAELRRIKRTAEEVFAQHRIEADAEIQHLEASFQSSGAVAGFDRAARIWQTAASESNSHG